jgi:hypothetical protein
MRADWERKAVSEPKTELCEQCGEPYAPKLTWHKFCTPKCQSLNWNVRHPRINLGGVKLEGKPTVEQLEAAGYKVRRRA